MSVVEVLVDNSLERVLCNALDIDVNKGDLVIVNIGNILYSAQIVAINLDVALEVTNMVVRKSDFKDLKIISDNTNLASKCLEEAKKIQKKLGLSMTFIDSYYTYDKKQLYFLFVADNRVDFRELAKKLADKYKTRIELRQIGVRDKAKRIGGLGPCGLFLCCNSFLTDFSSVSINMAKNQFLALNPSKINGVCGRLLCCLNYEDSIYSELREGAPRIGSLYMTKKGKGKVVSVDIFNGTCLVELNDKNVITVNYNIKDESFE